MRTGNVPSFRINAPRVVHDTVGGETLAIDSETGVYCSLRGSGAAVWELLAAGGSVATLAASLAMRYEASTEVIAVDLEVFLARLVEEHLVIVAGPDAGLLPPPLPAPAAKESWAAPALEKLNHMERLKLIDPIHMVEEDGWPHEKKRRS